MVGESSPDFACGQILFGLKWSNLHYMVKETPYSMNVTIRKKFVKDFIEKRKDSELYILKAKVKDLMTNLALAQVECEEME